MDWWQADIRGSIGYDDAKTLRAWLKALPAFEDFEAEQQALDLVVVYHDSALALDFLVQWPDLKRAATLVHRRLDALDGRRYEILRLAAEVLADDHPDAAALLYRLLVTAVLDRAASKNYPYAARDYHAAAALADATVRNDIADTHSDWVEVLRQRHGRKIGFWTILEGESSR